MSKNAKTSYELTIDAKLDALKAASIVLLEVARAVPAVGLDVRELLDKLHSNIDEAWKEEE